MAWRQPGDKPLSEPRMVSILMHICVTRSQWVNQKMPQFFNKLESNCSLITYWLSMPSWDIVVNSIKLLYCLEIDSSPLDKMAAISQMIFSDEFLWKKISVFWLLFHWSLFLRVQLTITQYWFRYGLVPNRWHAIIWTNAPQFTNTYLWH